jgi:hypothetical protein
MVLNSLLRILRILLHDEYSSLLFQSVLLMPLLLHSSTTMILHFFSVNLIRFVIHVDVDVDVDVEVEVVAIDLQLLLLFSFS